MKKKTLLSVSFAMLLSSISLIAVAGDIANAAFNGKLKKVESMIKSGTDVNAKDENGSRAIILAANHHNYDIVKLLLDSGAKVDSKDSYGQTALFAACESPVFEEHGVAYLKITKLLVEKGADVNMKDGDGISLLKYCKDSEAEKRVIEFLKSKGAH